MSAATTKITAYPVTEDHPIDPTRRDLGTVYISNNLDTFGTFADMPEAATGALLERKNNVTQLLEAAGASEVTSVREVVSAATSRWGRLSTSATADEVVTAAAEIAAVLTADLRRAEAVVKRTHRDIKVLATPVEELDNEADVATHYVLATYPEDLDSVRSRLEQASSEIGVLAPLAFEVTEVLSEGRKVGARATPSVDGDVAIEALRSLLVTRVEIASSGVRL